ncbi:hypothetical protein KAR91_53305 [Candidatus Pacearchaeota archaeon]|nr:hypothetical protein [Candidatus Pacearchaeota archaeon]
MNKVIWYLKQLLPLSYKSQYKTDQMDPVTGKVVDDNAKVTCRWRMWFGRCFDEVYTTGWN